MRTTVTRLGAMLGIAALLAGGVVAGAADAAVSVAAPHVPADTLFVSPTATAGGADTSCATAKYSTIQSAVSAAPVAATVRVCKGTYSEDVLVQTKLTLAGQSATIDASGKTNGIVDTASGTRISGFTVTGARGEGIGVLPGGGAPRPDASVRSGQGRHDHEEPDRRRRHGLRRAGGLRAAPLPR